MRHPLRTPCIALAAAVVMALSSAGAVRAEAIPVVNAGFEDASVGVPYIEFTFGPPAGWSLHDPLGITGGEYGLQQTLEAVLEPFTEYALRVEIGNIASGTAMSGDVFDLDGFPGYRVDLLAGDVIVAQDRNTLAGSIPEGALATSVVTFATCAAHPQMGSPLAIRLVSLNVVDPAHPRADLEVDFDDVRLDAIPILSPADLDGSGAVDGGDLAIVLGGWGGGCRVVRRPRPGARLRSRT